MGNRAVITTSKADNVWDSTDLGVYLHWNGSRDNVEGFLKYCDMQRYRYPEEDCYGWAYLCHVCGGFFGDGLNVGINQCRYLDCANGDNGVYVIDKWKIIDRKCFTGKKERGSTPLLDMLLMIDEAMPFKEQLGAEKIARLLESKEPVLRAGCWVREEDS